jgi:hydroxypyruvate isomerase
MSALQSATVWWCLEDLLSPDEIIAISREIGYAGIELAPPENWPRIADAGLAVVSHRGHTTIENGLNRRENHDRIERELLESIELARQWHVPTLICFTGNRDGLDDAEGAEIVAEGLRRVAPAAGEAGVTLALELLNSKVDHPDYQGDHVSWGLHVLDLVGSPAVKALYDVYHMQIMDGDVIRTIQDHHPSFAHYHIAGNPGRNEPDDTQELNYPPILRAIEATGYTGFVGMEYLPTGDPKQSLRTTFDLLRSA